MRLNEERRRREREKRREKKREKKEERNTMQMKVNGRNTIP